MTDLLDLFGIKSPVILLARDRIISSIMTDKMEVFTKNSLFRGLQSPFFGVDLHFVRHDSRTYMKTVLLVGGMKKEEWWCTCLFCIQKWNI